MILAGMNANTQYYENCQKRTFINEMEEMFSDSFNDELIKEKEENYLYNKLYDVAKNEKYNIKRILELIEERANYYSILNLESLLSGLEDTPNLAFLKKERLSSYKNIINVLSNKDDSSYNEYYIEKFKGYFGE